MSVMSVCKGNCYNYKYCEQAHKENTPSNDVVKCIAYKLNYLPMESSSSNYIP